MNATATKPIVTKDPTKSEIDLALMLLNSGEITSTYYGNVGCACGCKGTHSTNKVTKRKRVEKMTKWIEHLAEVGRRADIELSISNTYVAVELVGYKLWIAYFEN